MTSVTSNIDFQDSAVWTGVTPGATSLSASGMTLTSVGGTLAQYLGASVMSPSDNATPQGWTLEVDAYNDTPEGLNLQFAQAQTSVTVTLYQMYLEKLYSPALDAEVANVTVHFSDGSTATTSVTATATARPGEASLTLNSSNFGGRTIVGVDLTPSLANPVVPANLQAQYGTAYNATHPYSEFTLKAVSFSHDNSGVQVSLSENGAVTEILGSPAPGALLSDTGVITFTDADTLDTHTASAVAIGVTQGTLTASVGTDSTGGSAGQVNWSYNVDATKFEYLAAGQTVVESFQVTIDDGHGGQVTQQVDVTVTGTNDAPLINLPASVVTGSVTEQANTANSAAADTAAGSVAFTDVDLADAHSATVAAIGSTLGTLSLNPVSEGAGAGSVGWTYSVADKALDYLAAGQTRVESFNVTVDDGKGGTAQQQVDITLTGSNDGPLVNLPGSVVSGSVNEIANVSNSPLNDTTTGSIAFTDLDLTDKHTITTSAIGSVLGSLTLGSVSESGGAGSVGWTYTVADKALDYLGAGQTRVEQFNVKIDDGNGGVVNQVVNVTLNGANDPPVVNLASSTVTATVTERANLVNSSLNDTASGVIAFTDIDKTDTHTRSVAAVGTTLGTLTLGAVNESNGAGTIGWSYSVVDKKLDYLGAGQTRDEVFNVTIDDGHGGTTVQAVTVTLKGVNDGPCAVTDTLCVDDHDSTGNVYNTLLSNDTDPDLNDTKTIVSVDATKTNGLVLFNSSSHSLVYVAAAEEYVNLVKGTATDKFTYTMSDSAGATSTTTVNVTIKGVANTDVGGSCGDVMVACKAEVMDGKGGNDILIGSSYDDVLKGGEGCDTLTGGRGADVLYGGNGDDLIYGSDGDDIILGGDGCNILAGGSGSDYFVMSAVSAKDTILDFEVGKDHLYFADGITVTSVKSATVLCTASTVLNLSDGGQVMLVGVKGVTDWHSLL